MTSPKQGVNDLRGLASKRRDVYMHNYTPGLGGVFWLRRVLRYGACHLNSYPAVVKDTTRTHLHLKPCLHSCYLDTTYLYWFIPARNLGLLKSRMQSKWSQVIQQQQEGNTERGAAFLLFERRPHSCLSMPPHFATHFFLLPFSNPLSPQLFEAARLTV